MLYVYLAEDPNWDGKCESLPASFTLDAQTGADDKANPWCPRARAVRASAAVIYASLNPSVPYYV